MARLPSEAVEIPEDVSPRLHFLSTPTLVFRNTCQVLEELSLAPNIHLSTSADSPGVKLCYSKSNPPISLGSAFPFFFFSSLTLGVCILPGREAV